MRNVEIKKKFVGEGARIPLLETSLLGFKVLCPPKDFFKKFKRGKNKKLQFAEITEHLSFYSKRIYDLGVPK